MSVYKCPACGRSHIDLSHDQPTQTEADTLTLTERPTEVRCKDCGWFGSPDDLKAGH